MSSTKRPTTLRSVNLLIDQHSNAVQKLAAKFGLIHATEAMCGFLSLAIVTAADDSTSEPKEKDILYFLETQILPWIVQQRQEYIQNHPHEFVPAGTSFVESQGRLSTDMYRSMMASTAEIADFLPMIKQGRDDDMSNVALLRNVLEGPPVDDRSIRFPRNQDDFISQQELAYIQKEKKFHGSDHYVQVAAGGGGNNTCFWSLNEFCNEVAQSKKQWHTIVDGYGHYLVLKVGFSKDSNNAAMVLEEFDTQKRGKDDFECLPLEHLVEALMAAWESSPSFSRHSQDVA